MSRDIRGLEVIRHNSPLTSQLAIQGLRQDFVDIRLVSYNSRWRTARCSSIEIFDVVETSEDRIQQPLQSSGAIPAGSEQSAHCPVCPVYERALHGYAERIGVRGPGEQSLTSPAVQVGRLDTFRVTITPIHPLFCRHTRHKRKVAILAVSIKVKVSSCETNLRATGRHLPYEITPCYLQPDISERAPP